MDLLRSHRPGRSVAIVLLLLSAAFAGILAAAPRVAAATFYHSGPITANPETWLTGDTHVLYGNVTVMPSARLVIQPGVIVSADPGVRLFVRGILNADGSVAQPISFVNNGSSPLLAWRGIQFNASSGGSVTRSSFDRVEQAIHAILSSPLISDNTIDQAITGIHLERSSSFVSGNRINRTNVGIQARLAGDPVLAGNIITNLTGNPAFGIYATNLNSLTVFANLIADAVGTDGRTPVLAGSRGSDGGSVVGILVNATATVTVSLNTITRLAGGRGGHGQNSASAAAGSGGNGGAAAGIVTVSSPAANIEWNTISDFLGGRGGNGGNSSGPATPGGNGSLGGAATGVQTLTSVTSARWISNGIYNLRGGFGGNGGTSANTGDIGRGGAGGNGYGLFSGAAMNGNASNNLITNVRSGSGGNSSNGPRGTTGGPAGEASGIWMLGVAGSVSFLNNIVLIVTGGDGGAGRTAAGQGGNVTGIVAIDTGAMFNSTIIRENLVAGLSGGVGGVGTNAGAAGGSAAGFGAVHVQLSASANTAVTVTGGKGGDAFIIANPAGRGGDATGFIVGNVPSATSSEDTVDDITKGPPGSGSGAPVSYGVGIAAIGSATIETRIMITNATVTSVGDLDISADNYAQATTLNTPFAPTKIWVAATGSLTVRNFLAVAVYWPDNFTFVNGPSILVADDGATQYNVSPPTGLAEWLVVTDRAYIGSPSNVVNNTTSVTVSYGSYSFWSNPRSVDMWTTHTEPFGMVDKDAPTSSAGPLPTYHSSLTFFVPYAYSDGNGTSVRNLTLWYRYNGGPWTQGPTEDVPGVPAFSFTASADGTYEFYTVARDWGGNVEAAPAGNDTWTIVDTTLPGSHVNELPTYETSLSFTVTWAPDAGVNDIFAYDIQANTGTGWRDWLTGVHGTSATYTATSQGVHQFRSIAIDQAGNREPTPAGNDTWTIVDTILPDSRVNALPTYQTSLTFTVSWAPKFDTRDIATYRIQSKDDNGPWVDWIPSTDASSASFPGVDGHTYQFRSISTDLAGNVETQVPATNDTWTNVDVTPPNSAVTPLPAYVNTLSFAITWSPVGGTSDIASYTVQSRDGQGLWTNVPGYVDTTATSGTFNGGVDGHAYSFRTIARDRAGNVGVAGNDTWTIVDTRPPTITETRPLGANTNVTPRIVITFSEPMDRASVQQAFAITPVIDGDYTWSADSTTMTFTPRPLLGGTQYTVIIGTDAMDLAGNRLSPQRTFQFVTMSAFSFGDFWWLFLLVAGAVAGSLFFILRRRAAGPPAAPAAAAPPKQAEAIIEDVFLLYRRDGVLIRHEARRLRPDVDTDILSGMLTAVQQFVKDALRGDDYAELNEMTVGHMHILIGRGKWLVLAARIEGAGSEAWTVQIERCIQDMEDHHWDQLEDWDGDMGLARILTPYVKKLIQGGYLQIVAEPASLPSAPKRGKAPPLPPAR